MATLIDPRRALAVFFVDPESGQIIDLVYESESLAIWAVEGTATSAPIGDGQGSGRERTGVNH
jgi:hypothetical protein